MSAGSLQACDCASHRQHMSDSCRHHLIRTIIQMLPGLPQRTLQTCCCKVRHEQPVGHSQQRNKTLKHSQMREICIEIATENKVRSELFFSLFMSDCLLYHDGWHIEFLMLHTNIEELVGL